MADGMILSAGAEAAVQRALVMHLRSDPSVQDIFGNPARIFDEETRSSVFPYARIERHESEPADAAGVPGTEHTITLTLLSRFGGRFEAKAALSALRHAAEAGTISVPGQNIVLALATYSDVFRTEDRRAFRGIIRIRIISEEILSADG